MLRCYNRGCGQKYDPDKNTDDSCRHHPGEPFFHDAYKGWSCCNKKTVDFTEFLNTEGCTLSKHSNVKPPESEKAKNPVNVPVPVIRPPIKNDVVIRPSLEGTLTQVTPKVAPALKEAIDALESNPEEEAVKEAPKSSVIPIGTSCKNHGCTQSYSSSTMETDECMHHTGVPIFHEGLKYWTCCKKKTTDFASFLTQPGCTRGSHKWLAEDTSTNINCRYDWHQTPTTVTVAVYAKMYHYEKSTVNVNPIRLRVHLVFPNQNGAQYLLDLELFGLIEVEATTVEMYPTKVEIVMTKKDSTTWTKLEYVIPSSNSAKAPLKPSSSSSSNNTDSELDLDDIEPFTSNIRITDISK